MSGQTGKLEVSIFGGNYNDKENTYLYLVNSQAVTVRSRSCNTENPILIDSLQEGKYSLEFYIYDTLVAKHLNINIKENWTTYIDIQGLRSEMRKKAGDTLDKDMTLDQGFHFTFSPKQMNPPQKILNETFSFGGSTSFIGPTTSYFGMGGLIGTSVNYTTFNKDTTFFPPGPHQHERYLGWGIQLGLLVRISGYNLRSYKNGFKFDLGVIYNLPVIFRHTVFDGTTRSQHMGIHQFTEFYGLARIGYKNIVLQGEYNLTEFLIGKYPEVMPLRLGIAILFQDQ